MNRAFYLLRVSCVLAGVVAASLGLVACGSQEASGAPNPTDADVPEVGRSPCSVTAECRAHNEVCVRTSSTSSGTCQPPTGRCNLNVAPESQCYPDARCQAVPTPGQPTTTEGLCSFQAPARSVFDVSEPKIELTSPTAVTVLRANDGVSLRWMQARITSDAITVAVVMNEVPSLDGQGNRLARPEKIVWIWSSAEPTGPVMAGAVPLQYGRAGLMPDGRLGAEYGRNTLADGRYWWFVYAIRNGRVFAASDVQPFRVGADYDANRRCAGDTECVTAGELPETVACINGFCRQRCASDFDCPPVGSRCALERTFTLSQVDSGTVRRGAFCESTVPTGGGAFDGGAPDASASDGAVIRADR